MSARRLPRLGPRTAVAATAAVGSIVAGAALQRRHLRAIADDEDFRRLSEPLGGRPLTIESADGTALHAEAFGPERAPTVVLAHGWTEQLAFWGPVIRLLEGRGLRVVAYDLRGHGASGPATDGDYSMERFGEDVEAVLAAVGGDEPVTVVGHSLGAMSIAAWAEHHDSAARARAGALVNTGLGDLISGHLLIPEVASWLNRPWAGRALLSARAPLPPFSSPLQQAVIRYSAFGPGASAGDVAFYERMLMHTPSAVRAATGVALSDMNLWHAVAKLTIPTLVVAGERDRLTPPDHARRIARTLPNPAGLIELPGTGHMSPLERPRELSAAIEQLITESARPPAGLAREGLPQ
ncbi:MAG TPA: alpha/beta hydrolase [Solirubrobacteraceae bacterium]